MVRTLGNLEPVDAFLRRLIAVADFPALALLVDAQVRGLFSDAKTQLVWQLGDAEPAVDWPLLTVDDASLSKRVFSLAQEGDATLVLVVWLPAQASIDLDNAPSWQESVALLKSHSLLLLRMACLRRDLERLDRAERLQRALFAISDLASSTIDTADFLRGLHEIVGRLMYAENFFIVSYSPERDALRFIYFADSLDPLAPDPDEEFAAADMPHSVTLGLLRHGQAVRGSSRDICEQFGIPPDADIGPESEDWIGVPMVEDGVVRGAVVVQSYNPAIRYRDEDVSLLSYVAQHILVTLVRHEAHEQLERRVEERTQALSHEVRERQRGEALQAALYRIADLASCSDSIESFYVDIHRVVGGLIDARNFFIALLSEDGEMLEFPYSVDERDARRIRRRLASGLTERVLRSGEPLLAHREQIEQLFSTGEVASFGTPSVCWLGVPLVVSGRTVGVIAVQSYNPEHVYAWRDQELLSFVALHIASALERRMANESLLQAYNDLEQRVASRTHELAHSNRKLQDQIAVRESMERTLKHDAMHDALTGLPNRAHLLQQLRFSLDLFATDSGQAFAVLFLDLDRFKVINDSVGHLVGDELLKEVAKRLHCCIREPDMVARLGGDEFAVVVGHYQDSADVVAIAERIIRALSEPVRASGKELYTSASIGIAFSDVRYSSPEELLRDADVAMYRAKSMGRQRYAIFDEQLHDAALRVLEMEGDLRRALQRNEFIPYYQPIVGLESGEVIGFEALVRWQRPGVGLVAPGSFLGLCEETGCLEAMDWQIYEQVCRDVSLPAFRGRYVTINVSPRHLCKADFANRLLCLLEAHQVSPAQICLEITEGALLEQPDRVRACLERLRGQGIVTLLDDFGTGYSSLSYLHRFPLYGLKIDRSFVAALGEGEAGSSAVVIRAIRVLAESLGLVVIAEGIETDEQRRQLCWLGLRKGQGYLFARPMPRDDLLQQELQAAEQEDK